MYKILYVQTFQDVSLPPANMFITI